MPHDTPDTRVTLTREEGYRFRVRFGPDGAPAIVTDEPPPLGAGAGPSPTGLLAAAVGGCLASSLMFCMGKARLEVQGFEVEVSTTMSRDPDGRLRIGAMHVSLAPSVTAATHEAMGRCLELFERFCTVTQSVRRGIDVTVAVEPRADAAAEAPRKPTSPSHARSAGRREPVAGPPCAPAER